jgi:hypothetical protein
MIALALIALALSAPPACTLPPVTGAPPWSIGETMTYDLDLLGMVKAGTLQLSVERPMSGGKVIPLRARAKSDASLGKVTKLAAVALSWIDARTLLPERYREEAQEDGTHKVGDARLSPPGPQVTISYRINDKETTASYPRSGEVLDAVSAIYRLRATKIAPGDRFCFELVARGRFWRVEGSAAAKTEKVDTPVGKLETIRIDAQARRAGASPGAAPVLMHLWISTDASRLLVAAVGEIDAGPVRAMLASVRGARRP